VSPVGLDEEAISNYIREEGAEKQLDLVLNKQ